MPAPGTITLEQAWHYFMSQLALKNPGLVFEGNLARKALANMMTRRSGGR